MIRSKISEDMTLKRDILKSEFTLWINTLAYRAKIDYIREKSKYANIIELLETCETQSMPCIECNEVKFESEWLAEAFSNLSVTQQKILTMIYFENINIFRSKRIDMRCFLYIIQPKPRFVNSIFALFLLIFQYFYNIYHKKLRKCPKCIFMQTIYIKIQPQLAIAAVFFILSFFLLRRLYEQ